MKTANEFEIARVDEAGFLALKEEWNSLLSRSKSDTVFLRWEWINAWWRIFRRSRALYILTVRRESRLVGIAPFFIEPAAFPKPRRLRFCSDELAPDYMDLIAEPGLEREVVSEVARYVVEHSRDWDALILDDLLADGILLGSGALLKGLPCRTDRSIACPYIAITGKFDDYFQSRPEIGRTSLEKKIRNLFKNPNIRHVSIENAEDLSKGLAGLFELHKSRADGKGIRSDFTARDVERFHGEISRIFLDQGMLKFHMLYDGESPISTHYSFVYKNKLFFFNQGFNAAYKKWSVGAVNIYLTLEKAFKEGLSEYDFLKGEEPYKAAWANGMREQRVLRAYSPTWRGASSRAADFLISAMKRVKRAF